MSKKRKTEEEIRLERRVASITAYYKKAMEYLDKNPTHTCYIILSNDDYGNNFEEDTTTYIRTIVPIEEVTEGVDSKYFTWLFSETTQKYFTRVAEANSLKTTIYFTNLCHKIDSDTPIGHVSDSGNLRKGYIAVAGIMLSNRAKELL